MKSDFSLLEKTLLKEIKNISDQLSLLIEEITELEKKQNDLLSKFKSLCAAYKLLTGKEPAFKKVPLSILLTGQVALESTIVSGANAKLGDALSSILREHKALEINKAIELLRERKVKLSLKNPRNVLANLVKNDAQKRFMRLEDGKISLREK